MFELAKPRPRSARLFGTTVGIGSQGILFDGTRGAEGASTCRAWPPAS
jgi:hypothetical protein